jgi:iron complex transport system ATP-binding protein
LINNTDYKKLGNKAISQMISYVPQFLDTVFDLQVIDFLLMVSSNGNTSVNKNDFDRVYNALERIGIQHFAQYNINELSGGERQKVLIANALAQNTPLILLDEPISHLDWSSQIEIFKLLREIATLEKRKVIVIVHDINLISTYCDNALLMKSGNIAAYGKTSEVLQPQTIQNVFGLNVHTVENYFIPSI